MFMTSDDNISRLTGMLCSKTKYSTKCQAAFLFYVER